MPASRTSLALTDSYRDRLLGVRLQAALTLRRAWAALDPRDLDTTFGRWLDAAAAFVGAAKRAGVAATDAYLAAYLSEELATDVRARGIDPEPYLPTVDGRDLRTALLPALFTVKATVAQGRDVDTGLAFGLHRATRIAAVEVMDAPRRALRDLMQEDDRIRGYRRATAPMACGACLALATEAVLPPAEPLRQHTHCRCTAEPVVRGVRERVRRPTGREYFDALTPAQQAALFHGRGGAEKADLIRTGAVPFEALVERTEQAVTPDQFTEASLAALRAKATGPDRDGGASTQEDGRDG